MSEKHKLQAIKSYIKYKLKSLDKMRDELGDKYGWDYQDDIAYDTESSILHDILGAIDGLEKDTDFITKLITHQKIIRNEQQD